MLHVDISGTLAKVLTPSYGIPDQEMLGISTSMRRVTGDWLRECESGMHSWTQDPFREEIVAEVEEVAARVKKERIQTVLWIGIGGNSLGPRVLQEAFERPDTVEFLIIDTIDPALLQTYLSILDWRHTLIVIASKSGDTLESLSAFFYFWEALTATLKAEAAKHVVAITDFKTGFLRSFCLDHGIPMLPIPRDTGGRYSIFTPVGLLPLALLDGDIRKFIQGAVEMQELCCNETLEENPAALLASVQFLLETKKGYNVRVIMPYSGRLAGIARWNQQLIAESLGKNEVHNPVPLAAQGTQDQHSLLQQWMAGPRKQWHIFITETEKPRLFVPENLPKEWHEIAGKTFGQLLDACYEGTRRALTSKKRPHATIALGRLDEFHLGQLFFLFLSEVVFLGKLYRIDPYGQPAVDVGKQITKEILMHGRRE